MAAKPPHYAREEREFMEMPVNINTTIELAVAPVFLLVAIGSFLNVMTQRLARAIDRARKLEDSCLETPESGRTPEYLKELAVLDRRIVYSQRAITVSAFSALVIAVLVAVIFLSDISALHTELLIEVLFILAMLGIIVALCFFLAEIYIATRTVRVRTELLKHK